VALGVAGVARVGVVLVPFIVAGPVLVVAYNAELFGGFVHSDAGFAACWGAFPLLAAYVGETGTLRLAPAVAAAAAFALSWAQRALSTPARLLRRLAATVEGTLTLLDGSVQPLGSEALLAPLEGALRALSWGVVALAAALALARLT